jgi:predicted nuclease of predicted toxin-antitoxin system
LLIKLDENLGERGRQLFVDAGHDVATVADQGLAGAVDPRVIEVCGTEQRCLVTLDLDFSNPFLFPPEQYAGIAVLRLPRRMTPNDLYATLGVLIAALAQRPIAGKLWIVERHRIREYLSEDSDRSEP